MTSLLAPGTRVGDYRVVSHLGEGASGAVYVAEPTGQASSRLGERRQVALKVLHPHLATDHQLTKRFEREAQILKRLSGEHLVPVLELGRAGDQLYMALELVQGVSLEQALRHARPSLPHATRIITEVCAALEAAHSAGAIHRDLKPSNIMLEPRGALQLGAPAFEAGEPGELEEQATQLLAEARVRVLDFGMAKLVRGAAGGSVTALTEQNMVFGTPEYMSPEQAKGDEVDSTTDVYAAGVILYQLVTGRLPFQKATAIGTMTAHLTEPPTPPSQREGAVPPAIEAVILHALAKDPDRRYLTASELKAALARATHAPLDTDSAAPAHAIALSDTQREIAAAPASRERTAPAGPPELQAVSLDAGAPASRASAWWLSLALLAALLSIAAGVAVSMSLS